MKSAPILCTVHDGKGEMTKLIGLCGQDVSVFTPDQLPRNVLAMPKANPRAYLHGIFACLARYANLHTETWILLPGLRLQMERARRPGQSDPSLVDFEKMLRVKGQREGRANLITAARGIATWIELLGQSSRTRRIVDEP